MISSHPREPIVDERGLSDPSLGSDGNDVYMRICPDVIQKSDVLLSTENIASGDGQSRN
jgi:hypothetical protein